MSLVLSGMLACCASTAAAPLERAEPLTGDQRLAVEFTVHAEGIALGELLPRISKAVEVPLAVAPELRDERVVVLGAARPLREVLLDVAALFGGRWRPYRTGSVEGYRLVRALRESRRQLEARRSNDPVRRYLLDPKARFANTVFAGLSRAQRQALFERGQVRLFFAALPPAIQQVLLEVHREQEAEAQKQAEIFRSGRLALVRRRGPPNVELSVVRAQFVNGRPAMERAFLRMYPGGVMFAQLEDSVRFPPVRGNPYTGEPVPADTSLPAAIPELPDGKLVWLDRLLALSEKTESRWWRTIPA